MKFIAKLPFIIPIAIQSFWIAETKFDKYQVKRQLVAPYNKEEEFVIPFPEIFRQKLKKLKEDGLANIQIVSDFDQTLTRYRLEDKILNQSYATIQKSRFVSEQAKQKYNQLYDHYRPIEIDSSIPFEQKAFLMLEW